MEDRMTAQQLKNSILQMAVQGKLVPQDPNDEPASVLLERIKKEKEELIKAGKIKKSKTESFIFRGADNLHYEQIGKEVQEMVIEQPYYSSQNTYPPRYYQRIAINRTVDAIARGQNRLLLVMATGFRVIIVTVANSLGNIRAFELLPKLKTKKYGWCIA